MATSATGFLDSRDGELSSTGTPPATTDTPLSPTGDPPADTALSPTGAPPTSMSLNHELMEVHVPSAGESPVEFDSGKRQRSSVDLAPSTEIDSTASLAGVTGSPKAVVTGSPIGAVSELRGAETPCTDAVQPSKQSIPFVPSLGAWAQRIKIIPELKDPIPQNPLFCDSPKKQSKPATDILPPEIKENGQLRFPWAEKMDPKIRNLYRTTSPTYLEDGTPMVEIPNHVLMQGLENQKEYVIGQFSRCSLPPGGLIHAVANRIWGNKCKIFSRKLGDSSVLFHIPDESTRAWVLERRLWQFDGCIMFVVPWSPAPSLADLPEITTIPLWVTLKNIPHCLYSLWGISWIASGLGAPMLSNKPWLDPTFMGEAKLMVEVELEKAFPQRIAATDKQGNVSMVSVEYSWIPNKCEKCGHFGHKKSRCLQSESLDLGFTASNQVVKEVGLAPTEAVTPVAAYDKLSTLPLTNTHEEVASDTPTLPSSETEPEATTPFELVASEATSPAAAFQSVIPTLPPAVAADATSLAAFQSAIIRTPPPAVASNATSPAAFQSAIHTPSHGSSPALVTFSSTSSDLVTENVEGGVFGSHFAALHSEFSGFEMGDPSQRTRGGRPIKPTQKVQEMQWTLVGGRKNRGRGGRGGQRDHRPPF
ncbi:unnamed protein product [Brassica rapa]|uniref:DUF4283 domain-containing protein n=1 Tax=Brassica campestris TaxID=3711 RepID=A0A8D9GFV3_BRACM|nr:unnamed protein product [Brassica rapa]